MLDQAPLESSSGRGFEGQAATPLMEDPAVQERILASAEAETSAVRTEEQLGAIRAQGQMLGARKVGWHFLAFLALESSLCLLNCPVHAALSKLALRYYVKSF